VVRCETTEIMGYMSLISLMAVQNKGLAKLGLMGLSAVSSKSFLSLLAFTLNIIVFLSCQLSW